MILEDQYLEKNSKDQVKNSKYNLDGRKCKTLMDQQKKDDEKIEKISRKSNSMFQQQYDGQEVFDKQNDNNNNSNINNNDENRSVIIKGVDEEIAQKRKRDVELSERKNELKDPHYKFYRQGAQKEITSIFNENELKRAPSLFEKYQSVIERQLERQMHQPEINLQKEHFSRNGNDLNHDQSKYIDENSGQIIIDQRLLKTSSSAKMCFVNFKQHLYLVFEQPMLTKEGSYVHFVIQFFIFLSVSLIIADSSYYDENSETQYDQISSALENAVFAVFLIEFIIRLSVYNSFGDPIINFFKNSMNIIDFLSLLPFFIDTIVIAASNYYSYKVGLLRVIRIVRLVRIVRIFKLSRYMTGLDTLQKSLNVSKKYFSFICATLAVFVIFISTIIYYFEKDNHLSDQEFQELGIDSSSQIKSIPQSIWFVLTTLTTLGYGDKLPLTIPSKIVVGFIVLISQSFVIGLPIAIVGFDFSNVYKEQKEQQKFNKEKEEGIQYSKGSNQKIKELQYMQQRLRKISKTNKLVRELSSRSSKMCYLITKDLVGLYLQVVLNEQKQIQQQIQKLKLTGNHKSFHNWQSLQKFFGKQSKIKMENIKVTNSLRSPLKKERFLNGINSKTNEENSTVQDLLNDKTPDDELQSKQEINTQNQEQDENDNKINSQFVRNNLKKLKTLLVSNATDDISFRQVTRIIQPEYNQIPNSNYGKFHPSPRQHSFFQSFKTQKSEEFHDNHNIERKGKRKSQNMGNLQKHQFDSSQINLPLSSKIGQNTESGFDKSHHKVQDNNFNQNQHVSKDKKNMNNRLSGVMHQAQLQQALKPGGDNVEEFPDFQNQLEFLNEILMDLVSEDSLVKSHNGHELDEYNETCSEIDENAQFFEIEKTERKKKKQKRIMLEGNQKINQPALQLLNVIQQARKQIKQKTIIQEVTESNNESLEFNPNLLKQSQNTSSITKQSNQHKTAQINEDDKKQNKIPLSISKQVSSSSFSDLGSREYNNFDSSLRLKQNQVDKNEQKLHSSLNLKYQRKRNPSNESLSSRKQAQIKHESYQNLFESRLSPGEAMIKINKKKTAHLSRAKTMYIKKEDLVKSRIEECSDEDDNYNSPTLFNYKEPRTQQNNHFNSGHQAIKYPYQQTKLKKANSLNFIFSEKRENTDQETQNQDFYLNQTKFDLQSEYDYSPDQKSHQLKLENKNVEYPSPHKKSQIDEIRFEKGIEKTISYDKNIISHDKNRRGLQFHKTQISLQKVKHPEKLAQSVQLDQVVHNNQSIQNLEAIEQEEDQCRELNVDNLSGSKQINTIRDSENKQFQRTKSSFESEEREQYYEGDLEQQKNKYNFQDIILDLQLKKAFSRQQKSTKDIEQ